MAGESNLQKKCKKYSKGLGVLFHKVESKSARGWPDVLLIFPNGAVVFVEMKNPNGEGAVGRQQVLRHKEIRERNGIVYCCDNFEFFKQIIDRHI